jgi:hypothetical protein
MHGARKVLLALLAIVLLASLLGTAFATSAKYTVSDPKKIEKWLGESKIYDHFVNNAVEQGQKSVGSTPDTSVTSLSDTAVQDAARSAFSQQLVQSNINKFIESNYDWLEGKTATPSFVIDLTSAKQSFAEQVGTYVTTHLAGLPACTDLATAQAQAADPLNASCRPPSVNPQAAGAQVTQQIASSDELLSNPVLTAQNINPEPGSQKDPYYEKLAHLPKAYQFGQKLPYIFAGLVVLSALALALLYSPRRKGVRLVGIIFAIAGLILVLVKFTSDMAFRRLEDRVFNPSTTGELQRSLTSFAHQVENASVKIDFWFGIIFLLIALVILLTLRFRKGSGSPPTDTPAPPPEPAKPAPTTKAESATTRLRTSRPPKPDKPLSPPRTKPPRLVQ